MNVRTNRRDFLKFAGAAAFWAMGGGGSAGGAVGRRPNFVIMIADDMAWDDAGAYGHPHIRTPNIDRLAKEGVRFTNAFLTCASCSPSRCSIMTGRYPHSTGAKELHQPLPADQVVFAGLLKEAGYYTAAAGKWHLGSHARVHFDNILDGGGPSGCENWVKALRQRPKDRPFFMWLAAVDPHRDYSPNTIPEPHRPEDAVVPPFLPDNAATRKDLAMYYDEITRMDGFIGEVLDELDAQDAAEDTLVMFLSDNGRPFPRCKTTVYDSGVKTPFIVRLPGRVQAGSTCEGLVSSVDIAPTLIELGGGEISKTFQGRSFARMLKDTSTRTRQYVFAEHNWHDYQAHSRGVRSNEWLYIRNAYPHLNASPPADAVRSITYQEMIRLEREGKLAEHQRQCFVTPRPKEELYDIKADPYSLRNLAQDARHAGVLRKMRAALEEWIEETDDRVPEPPTRDRFDRWTGRALPRTGG